MSFYNWVVNSIWNMLKVRDKKTNTERIVTRRAYEILKKRYQLIEDIGDNEVVGNQKTAPIPNVQTQPRQIIAQGVPDAEPVVDEVVEGITVNPGMEKITETVERKKPGRKPKSEVNA